MKSLAINGGNPVREKAWPTWPMIEDSDVQAVADAVRSCKWSMNLGTQVREFETEFAAYNHARHAIAVNSGSSALQVALAAREIGVGDEVIVPTYTYVASANAALLVGATPILVDVEADTYNICPAAIEAAITPRTRAIIAVHFSGAMANIEALKAIADKHNLALIEDAAHSHGGRYDGQALGTFGVAGCFSFQASKNLNCGEGGCILTNDDDFARIARAVMSNGRIEGGAWYGHFLGGGTFRMTEMQAALLRSQLRRLKEQTQRRDENGRALDAGLAAIDGLSPMRRLEKQELHPYHLYMFRFDEDKFGMSRARFLECMNAEGIPVNGGYAMPLHRQPLFSGEGLPDWLQSFKAPHRDAHDYNSVACPNAERACEKEAVWLGQSVLLAAPDEMQDIIGAAQKVRAAM
jgi:dTDP-4-amino-4,6-dideoxygalactose transaminase